MSGFMTGENEGPSTLAPEPSLSEAMSTGADGHAGEMCASRRFPLLPIYYDAVIDSMRTGHLPHRSVSAS